MTSGPRTSPYAAGMTQPEESPATRDEVSDAGGQAARTAGERGRIPSAAESGEQWSAADELLEGQPTALGE